MWQATGEVSSKIPTLPEIRNGAFSNEGWSHEGQMEHRGTNPHDIHRRRLARTSSASTRTRKSSITPATPISPAIEEEPQFFPKRGSISQKEPVIEETTEEKPVTAIPTTEGAMDTGPVTHTSTGPDEGGTYPNGYRFPRKHTWTQSLAISSKAFWKFFLTPFGFLITIYGLNVVGWGAMIFFVLLKAAPAMCHPSCDDYNSSRKKWIEYDSQILNALFCVTGFGLIPWRFRDFYYLMKWRVMKDQTGHRKLAGLYRGWYRLPGSDQLAEDIGPPPVYSKKHPQTTEAPPPYSPQEIGKLESNPAVPLPATSMPEPPLTGMRAPPSRSWTLDFVIWMYMLNTIFQAFLCGFMWGWGRRNRPSIGVGLFITLGCLVGIFAGVVAFREGTRIKKIEGIPIQEYDVLESIEDYHDRKAKEDAELAKKESHHLKHEASHQKHLAEKEERHMRHEGKHRHKHRDEEGRERHVLANEKVKGHEWFTRH